jgi:hypothetical protein
MKADRLAGFLEGRLLGGEVEREIAAELHSWKRALSERGRTARIHLDNTSAHFQVTADQVRHLLLSTVDGTISGTAASYFVDALLLSDVFEIADESLRDLLEGLSESQLRGCIHIESARQALAALPGVSYRR